MHIIIDGYNVLKQKYGDKEISLVQRRAFIAWLSKYAALKSHRIVVVFDGGPYAWPSQEKDHGVTVIYSGSKKSADDIIKGMLVKKMPTVLVTADNEIKAAGNAIGATMVEPLAWYELVKKALIPEPSAKKKAHIVKTTEYENPFVDTLMYEDSMKMPAKEDEVPASRSSNSQQLSKKERRHWQKIKKL